MTYICWNINLIQKIMELYDKPLAIKGLTSYRYRGRYGFIMIGAKDHQDALNEARRSTVEVVPEKLQVYNGKEYENAFDLTYLCEGPVFRYYRDNYEELIMLRKSDNKIFEVSAISEGEIYQDIKEATIVNVAPEFEYDFQEIKKNIK